MKIAVLGKRRYAFGLSWCQHDGQGLSEFVRDKLGEGTAGVYCHMAGAAGDKDGGSAAYGPHNGKGRVYSYAQALASCAEDGIYVAPMEGGQIWYLALAEGRVLPGSDRCLDAADAPDTVLALASTLGLRVYVADGVEDIVPSAARFDPVGAVKQSKAKALKRVAATSSQLAGALFLAAVVGCVGVAGWYLFHEETHEVDPAVAAALVRSTYLKAVKTELQTYPANNRWLARAYGRAQVVFPEFATGWGLDGITCTPSQCRAVYSLPTDGAFAISPIYDLFGKSTVTLLEDNKSLMVIDQLEPDYESFSEQSILNLQPAPMHGLDVVGRLGLYFSGLQVEKGLQTSPLISGIARPPGAPEISRQQIVVGALNFLEPATLKGLTEYMEPGQFRASSLSYSTGSSSVATAWKIEWQRITTEAAQ